MISPSLEEFREKARHGNLIPVWREMLADLETPVSAFLKIGGGRFAFLLESVENGEQLGRYSFIGADSSVIFKSKRGEHEVIFFSDEQDFLVRQTPLDTLRHLMHHYRPVEDPRLPPFYGGAVGYMAYDCVRDFEKLPDTKPDDLELPDAFFMFADTLVAFDHVRRRMILIACAHVNGDPDAAYRRAVHRIERLHDQLRGNPSITSPRAPLSYFAPSTPASPDTDPLAQGIPLADSDRAGSNLRIVSNVSREQFEESVRRAKEYILAGDIFQVVLSQRLSTQITCDPFDVYRAIRAINPSPYMFYLKCGELKLAGSSPEILVRTVGRQACVRPIAGTRPRGATPEADAALEKDLLADEKERAEHVMLVDLGRNDLGRVCAHGTVRVDGFMEIERYSHVMHIVSNVVGELPPGEDAFGVMAATFPAGTVSGAPKIRAMEIIDELEPNRRGPYAGAVGYFAFGGDMDACITIRTAVIKGNVAHVQAGAGIVADSVPEREYEETLSKARALMKAIEMAERGLE